MELLLYVGKVSLYWVLFFICYWLLLRRHTFFIWNRLYLIGSLVLSFGLPFVIYPASAPAIPAFYEISAQTVTVSAQSPEDISLFTAENLLWFIYLAGVLFTMVQFISNTRKLIGFLKAGELIELEDCKVVLIDSNQIGSFSFLQWIVVNRNDYENHFDAILRHEMVHTKQWHTIDIMLLEMLKIAFWFNPILLLYKQCIQEVHEFLADSQAPNRDHYARFLVAYALNAPIASLTNHFFKPSQMKTRIQMIYKNRTSKWMLGSYMLAMGTIGIISLVIAGCERRESDDLTEVSKKLNSVEKMSATDGGAIPKDRKVFTVVEEQPTFPGGVKQMFEFLGKNIKYPEAASKANVGGRVFLSFVVSETGEIEDIVILKGLGYGCDAEAVRVIKAFPKWNPGKQNGMPVNVKYNLPINFQLEDVKNNKKSSTTNSISKVSGFKNDDGSDTSLTSDGRVLQESKNNVYVTGENPMYVLNGKIIDDKNILKKISPDDIKRVDVLKDQSAVEKYGEKGKQGVVMITTKTK